MQDKTINNALQQLYREAMNGNREGLEHIAALMRLRGVEPTYKRPSPIGGGTRRQTRNLVLDALKRGVTCNRAIGLLLLDARPDLTYRQAQNRVYLVRYRIAAHAARCQ